MNNQSDESLRDLLGEDARELYDTVTDMYPPWGYPSQIRCELPFRYLIQASEDNTPTPHFWVSSDKREIARVANKPEILTKAWGMLDDPAWQTSWKKTQKNNWRRGWVNRKLIAACIPAAGAIALGYGGHPGFALVPAMISIGILIFTITVVRSVEKEEKKHPEELNLRKNFKEPEPHPMIASLLDVAPILSYLVAPIWLIWYGVPELFRYAKGSFRNDNENCSTTKKIRKSVRGSDVSRVQISDEAIKIIDDVRDQLGRYRTDLFFLTEYPALFDIEVSETAEFFTALAGWEDNQTDGSLKPAGNLREARRVKKLFNEAIIEAKARGIDYLNTDRRILARRAQLLTAKAASTPSASEKEALMAKVAKILADLNIAFLAHKDITAITTTNHPAINPGPGGRPDADPSPVRSP